MANLAKWNTVGTSTVQLGDGLINEAVLLICPIENSVPVYVDCFNAALTADTDETTGGTPIYPGGFYGVTPYMCGRDSKNIYLRAASANQKVNSRGY